mmetsp:Transcript_27219/g.63829  ORF Transcript_27219/g.63829 Transcript_27219/m.63829 type:complete len:349 (+) Transcript_27219:72-1118(+)
MLQRSMIRNHHKYHSPIFGCLFSLLCCFSYRIFSAVDGKPGITFTFVQAVNPSPDFSPSAFSYRHRTKEGENEKLEEVDLGTTLVAIKYSGGVIVGADTRTSVGGYVSNKFAYKINPIFQPEHQDVKNIHIDGDTEKKPRNSVSSSSCVLCRSGSAADTQWLAMLAKRRFRSRKLERPGSSPSLSEVAHYLRYQMRNSNPQGGGNFQASLICAGYDEETKSGRIFGITPGGSLWEENDFCVSGSGSTILLGFLDDALEQTKESFSKGLTEVEGIALVTKLLQLSIARDGSSGGLVRLYLINRDGLEERTVYPFSDVVEATGGRKKSGIGTSNGEKGTCVELEGFASPR